MQPLALLGMLLAAGALGLPFARDRHVRRVAGVFASPITTLTRTLWRHRFEREEDRRTAFALDAVHHRDQFHVGPAIIAGILATAGSHGRLRHARSWSCCCDLDLQPPAGSRISAQRAGERHLLGPSPSRDLCAALRDDVRLRHDASGSSRSGYPAYATTLGAPALAGLLLARELDR